MEWESMYSSQMEAHGSSNETHKEWKLLSLVSPNTSPSSLFPETITAVPGQTHLHNKLTHTSQQHQGCQTQIEHRLREAVWFNFRLKIQSWKITSFFFSFSRSICLTTHSKRGIQPVTSASILFPLKHLLTFHIPRCLSVSNFTARKRPALS